MGDLDATQCLKCGRAHPTERCEALRAAAAQAAEPPGVPPLINRSYNQARAALRADDAAPAIVALQRVLGHLASERGVPAGSPFAAQLRALCDDGAISPRMRAALFERVVVEGEGLERAWALMSVVEHALARLYLHREPVPALGGP